MATWAPEGFGLTSMRERATAISARLNFNEPVGGGTEVEVALPMSAVPSLLIADRGPTRFGVRLALEGAVVMCAEAGSAEEAIRLAKQTQPDVCLIGWEIPGGGKPRCAG